MYIQLLTTLFQTCRPGKEKSWFPRVYGGTDPFSKSLVEYRSWYATVVNFNSIAYLEKSELPIFWIFGDPQLDKQGPVAESLKAVEKLMEDGKSYSINSFTGQGHNIKESKYELSLYNWLRKTLSYDEFKFKKH